MVVCVTGPLVALSNARDEHYLAANNLFRDLHMAGEMAAFLDAVADGTFVLVDLTSVDIGRMAELVRMFASFPLGGTDASVVAVAERLGAQEIATFDRRHFSAIRPKHGGHFTLLSEAPA
jgi:predicted nucleic acid-binding protein